MNKRMPKQYKELTKQSYWSYLF